MTRPVPVEVGLVTTRLRTFFARNGLRVSVVVICLVFSAILWTGLLVQLNIERERIIESKRHENDNLARVFEEHVARTIRAAEITLREIASEYRRYGRKFDLVQYAKDRNIYLDPYNVLSVIDANGNLALSTSPPHTPTNYRKYDNFQYHTQHETSNIYISRPRLGDTTGKWTVYLSRRMNKADGSFDGNVTVGMDPTYFSRIYAELDLGKDATVILLKRDGIILARVSNSGAETTAGQNVADTLLFTHLLPGENHGSFIGASAVDGITRINSYRALKDYPLVVVIGTSRAVALADHETRRSVYMQAAGAMTVVILSLGLFVLFQIARSEREREERRRSEDLFRILAEGSPVGIFRADAASKCVYVNGRWCDIAGIRADAALGDGWASAIHPDDRERVFGEWTAAANNRQPFSSEYRFQRPDGNVTWVVGQARAETDSQGEVLSYVGTITDITERKRAEQQAQRLSNILEGSLNEIYVFDVNSLKFVLVNQGARANLGYTMEELRKLTPMDLKPEYSPESFAALVVPLRTGAQRLIRFSTVHRRKDGSIYPVEVHLQMFSDESPPVFVAVIIDITERKRAEETIHKLNAELEQRVRERTFELQSANKELETFTYSVAHDLKAPLRGIDGYSRLLLTAYSAKLDDEGRGFVQNIVQATAKMNELIEDLLAYSRLERRDMQIGHVDPQALIESLLADRADEIKTRGMAVSVAMPFSSVSADREGLAMALRNLMENALKFTRDTPQPTIEISGRDTGATRILAVRDNGVGFDMKFHDRIFDIFQRLHRSEDYPGTGVGLAIVKKTLQRMGGRAWAESAPGKGATFYLEIPK